MKRISLGNGIFSLHAVFIIFILYANPVSLKNITIKNSQISNGYLELNKTGVVISRQNCTRHLALGMTYKGPCVEIPSLPKVQHVTDIEVPDLISPHKNHALPSTTEAMNRKITTSPIPKKDYFNVDKIVQPEEHLHPNSRYNLSTGGIAAAACLTVAIAFYAGVMLWKRIVMNAYQNREVLLNDDDIGDINDEDMRHFEAACIQIEA